MWVISGVFGWDGTSGIAYDEIVVKGHRNCCVGNPKGIAVGRYLWFARPVEWATSGQHFMEPASKEGKGSASDKGVRGWITVCLKVRVYPAGATRCRRGRTGARGVGGGEPTAVGAKHAAPPVSASTCFVPALASRVAR